MNQADQKEELEEQACRVCGCSQDDCSGCIEKNGEPCHWIEEDLCSGCSLTAKDFALYLGCKYYNTTAHSVWELNPTHLNDYTHFNSLNEIKPILRPLSDMTHNEAARFVRILKPEARDIELKILSNDIVVRFKRDSNFPGISEWADTNRVSKSNPEQHKYLLSRHFDLFGWIADGLAIDATTLERNPYEED